MASKKELADYIIDEMFEADTDHNGTLTKEEIKAYLDATKSKGDKDIPDEEINDFIAAVDQNGDNKISRKELTQMIYVYYGVHWLTTLSSYKYVNFLSFGHLYRGRPHSRIRKSLFVNHRF